MHVPENNFLLEGYHQWLVESLQDAPSSSKRNELGLQSESVGSKQKLAKDNGEMGKSSVNSNSDLTNGHTFIDNILTHIEARFYLLLIYKSSYLDFLTVSDMIYFS